MEIDRFIGRYRVLSNFYRCDIPCINPEMGHDVPIIFPTVEHAYQAGKNLDVEYWQKIRQCKTPGQSKQAGKHIVLRPDWEKVKIDFMESLLNYKFSLPTPKRALISTNNARIVEGNFWHDNFWGDCLCKKCENKEGLNHLGKLLMKIRVKIGGQNGVYTY